MIDHDRLFKELLRSFFLDFLALFAPRLRREVEPGSIVFLDKELFTSDSPALAKPKAKSTKSKRRRKRLADVVARLRLRGRRSFVLVHVENQSQWQRRFARRMFHYLARLDERHELPVYPIALFSFDRPHRPEPDSYDLEQSGLHVLRFRFHRVQLNRLDWRDFMRLRNPVAAALMARMRIAPEERVRVKVACLRLLAKLRLDEARERQISGFVDTYLRFKGREQRLYQRQVAALSGQERERIMEITTSWKEEGRKQGRKEGRKEGRKQGRKEGRKEGKLDLAFRLLTKRVGSLSEHVSEQVRSLRPKDVDSLAEALLDFRDASDLRRWLDRPAAARAPRPQRRARRPRR